MNRENSPNVPEASLPPFKRRGHIVLALMAVLILVGLVPLSTMSWKLIEINRETLTTAQQEIQLLVASSIAHELDLRVDGFRSRLVGVAHTLGLAVKRRGTISREEIRRLLAEVADERLSYVRYTYFQQQDVKSVSAGDHPEHLEALFAASLRQAAEMVALNGGDQGSLGTFLSSPILLESKPPRPVVAVVAPVITEGSFRGVLSALVDLELVWGDVMRKRGVSGQVVFAVDERGTVFATNNRSEVRPGTDLRESELVRHFLAFPGVGAAKTMPFLLERHGESEGHIGTFFGTDHGWGIFVQAPDRKIYWTVGNMVRSTLLWFLALLGLAGLAAMAFARGLSNPINRLAAASRALAAGDYSARVEVTSRNEIGELAHTFNTMAAEIETTVQRLRRAFKENNELFLDTIRALAEAIDAKDPYTRGHSVRVNRYSVILARQLGLADAAIRDIHVSSLLHDVGKIGIEDRILQKTAALTDEEFEIIKTHTTKGASIMAPIRQMKNMIPGIRHHHERCNGRGYPDGLVREETPLMARIIAVADTFDAITTARPYQQPMSFDAAVSRINELSGPSLDSRVVDAFNRACDAGLIRLEEADAGEPPVQEITIPVVEDAPASART